MKHIWKLNLSIVCCEVLCNSNSFVHNWSNEFSMHASGIPSIKTLIIDLLPNQCERNQKYFIVATAATATVVVAASVLIAYVNTVHLNGFYHIWLDRPPRCSHISFFSLCFNVRLIFFFGHFFDVIYKAIFGLTFLWYVFCL